MYRALSFRISAGLGPVLHQETNVKNVFKLEINERLYRTVFLLIYIMCTCVLMPCAMCMRVCVHVHLYVHACVHACGHACGHACVRVPVCAFVHLCEPVCVFLIHMSKIHQLFLVENILFVYICIQMECLYIMRILFLF